MHQLYGEYECSVDDKGRIKLPSALLRNVGGNPPYKFFVNRGFEKCLMLYPEKVWDRIVDKVNNLNSFVTEERNFIRYFFRGLRDVATDSAERILLPKPLLNSRVSQRKLFCLVTWIVSKSGTRLLIMSGLIWNRIILRNCLIDF